MLQVDLTESPQKGTAIMLSASDEYMYTTSHHMTVHEH